MLTDILFIGHTTIDEITANGKMERHPGGGAYFGAASAGWCMKRFAKDSKKLDVLTIGRPDDFTRVQTEMTACNVKFNLCEWECTTTFLHSFENDDPDKRISSVADVARSFELGDFENIKAKLYYVNPLFFGEVPPELFPKMKERCELLSVDAQGLIRRRDGGKIWHETPNGLADILKPVDILKVDAEEAASLSGISGDTDAACQNLLSLGLKYLICTQKEGVAIYHKEGREWAPFGSWTLEGRTGRGDTISAAFLFMHFVLGMDMNAALACAAKGCTNKMQHAGCAVEADFSTID